ncbi:MAG: STAS domain-containing protein [Limisphaerales bacterium]|jgi:anti-anti-sigma factor|nr:STAS domain-containing protein [Verrucomicrobiota bacterium]
MAIIQASFSVARTDSCVVIKISGRANSNSSQNFKRLLTDEWEKGMRHFILDLSECIIMDSTFLGILVHFVEPLHSDSNVEGITAALYEPIPCILDLIEDLGASELFTVLDGQYDSDLKFSDLPKEPLADKRTLLENSILAHKTLLKLITDPEKKGSIEGLLELMESELKELDSVS